MRDLVFDDSGNLYAVGDFSASGSTPMSRVAKWDGSTWQNLVSTQTINNTVTVVEYDSTNHLLYIGGSFTNVHGISANRVARRNGTQWDGLGFSGAGTVTDMVYDNTSNLLYVGGGRRF